MRPGRASSRSSGSRTGKRGWPRAYRAAQWYAEQLGVERSDGHRAVDADLQLLRRQFDSLPDLIADIDDRNSRFSGVALRRLMYLLRHDKRVEGLLQLIVDALADGEGPDLEVDVYRCELLGADFLYTPPKRRPKAEARPLDRRQPADVDELRKKIAPKLRRPHTRAKLEELIERLLAGRTQIQFGDVPVGTDDEYVRAIYAAAFGLEKGTTYEFTPDPHGARTHHGPYATPSGTLRRKRRR